MEERRNYSTLGASKIMQMIEETDSPKDKAILMILLQISNDLFHNTHATEKMYEEFSTHKETFNSHVVEEQTLLNQGKGLYTAMSWMMGLASVLLVVIVSMGGFILSSHKSDNDSLENMVRTNSNRLTILEENMKLLRRDVDEILHRREK